MSSIALLVGTSAGVAMAQLPLVGNYVVPELPFGSTFPMTSTAAHNGQTWSGSVYYGTSMVFNDGFTPTYTNVYNVPVYNQHSGSGNPCGGMNDPQCPSGEYCDVGSCTTNGSGGGGGGHGGGGSGNVCGGTNMAACPTGEICDIRPGTSQGHCTNPNGGSGDGGWTGGVEDATGRYCTAFSSTSGCPMGYYCKTKAGYNPYAVGACQKTPDSYPIAAGGSTPNGPWNGNQGSGSTGIGTKTGSCRDACGFQTLTVGSECWCDEMCEGSGDCCPDRATACPWVVNKPNQPEPYSGNTGGGYGGGGFGGGFAPVCGPQDCGSAKSGFENGEKCHCDPMCLTWNDCCHDFFMNCQD